MRCRTKIRTYWKCGSQHNKWKYAYLGIHDVGLNPVFMLLVGDAETVGHLHTLFVHTSYQSSNNPGKKWM